jgi:hypothetical protein
MGWRNLSKTVEKSSSSPCAAGVKSTFFCFPGRWMGGRTDRQTNRQIDGDTRLINKPDIGCFGGSNKPDIPHLKKEVIWKKICFNFFPQLISIKRLITG